MPLHYSRVFKLCKALFKRSALLRNVPISMASCIWGTKPRFTTTLALHPLHSPLHLQLLGWTENSDSPLHLLHFQLCTIVILSHVNFTQFSLYLSAKIDIIIALGFESGIAAQVSPLYRIGFGYAKTSGFGASPDSVWGTRLAQGGPYWLMSQLCPPLGARAIP